MELRMIEFSTVFRIALTFIVIAILTCRLGKMNKVRDSHAALDLVGLHVVLTGYAK